MPLLHAQAPRVEQRFVVLHRPAIQDTTVVDRVPTGNLAMAGALGLIAGLVGGAYLGAKLFGIAGCYHVVFRNDRRRRSDAIGCNKNFKCVVHRTPLALEGRAKLKIPIAQAPRSAGWPPLHAWGVHGNRT